MEKSMQLRLKQSRKMAFNVWGEGAFKGELHTDGGKLLDN